MPERSETLIKTRCPSCSTIFRVTSAQLRQKAGKVRCGQCHGLFNAFDHLLPQAASAPATLGEAASSVSSQIDAVPAQLADGMTVPAGEQVVSMLEQDPDSLLDEALADVAPPSFVEVEIACVEEPTVEEPTVEEPTVEEPTVEEPTVEAPTVEEPTVEEPTVEEPDLIGAKEREESEAGLAVASHPFAETSIKDPDGGLKPSWSGESGLAPEDSAKAARDAGLMAARELVDTASYNRWSEGVLAGNGLDAGISSPAVKKTSPLWAVSLLLLVLLLLLQCAYYFRTEIVLRIAEAEEIYEDLGIDVPLPRNPQLLGIEDSDLQSDPANNEYVLLATLKNRAPYDQAWPLLELTLTNVNDAVISRRVLMAEDYLPSLQTRSIQFPANGELAIRLAIDAKDLVASGYRLYLFYP